MAVVLPYFSKDAVDTAEITSVVSRADLTQIVAKQYACKQIQQQYERENISHAKKALEQHGHMVVIIAIWCTCGIAWW